MKILLLITLSSISLNSFSRDLGEDKKSPCQYAVQSSDRDAKPVVIEHNTEALQAEKEVKGISI